jgi:mRNA-degrading endonuclease HigB of HigAB toxin-antitoxin module
MFFSFTVKRSRSNGSPEVRFLFFRPRQATRSVAGGPSPKARLAKRSVALTPQQALHTYRLRAWFIVDKFYLETPESIKMFFSFTVERSRSNGSPGARFLSFRPRPATRSVALTPQQALHSYRLRAWFIVDKFYLETPESIKMFFFTVKQFPGQTVTVKWFSRAIYAVKNTAVR